MVLSIVVASTGMAISPGVQIWQEVDESIWPKPGHPVPNVFTASDVASDVEILLPGVRNATGLATHSLLQKMFQLIPPPDGIVEIKSRSRSLARCDEFCLVIIQ